MKFEPMHTLLHRAKGEAAVPAINVFNMESIQQLWKRPMKSRRPLSSWLNSGSLHAGGVHGKDGRGCLAVAEVPVAFHLDHGRYGA